MAKQATHGAVLATYPSESTPGKFYEVRLGLDCVTYCTCFPWHKEKNRMARLGLEGQVHCSHTRKYIGE